MRRLLGLLLALSFFTSFTLHGLVHGEHRSQPCAVCTVSKSARAGEPLRHAAPAPIRTAGPALHADAEPASRPRLPGPARAPPLSF